MLFRRRNPVGPIERVRVFVWPRRSWDRSTRYMFYRLRRLRTSSHAIALGCSAGVFASFTPLLGLHFILAGIMAWVTRGSIIASALGTFVGNPITFPFIWIGTYKVGNWILDETPIKGPIDLSDGIFQSSFESLLPLLKPMVVGAVPIGILAAAVTYFPIRRAIEVYRVQRERRRKINPGAGQSTVQA